jgi:diguanylate cyclase (GGDEF)-like protein
LLTETDSHRAGEIVQRIKHILTIEMQIHEWPVAFSIGVLTCTNTALTVEEMVNKADELMYRVKNNGKNAISYSIYNGQH